MSYYVPWDIRYFDFMVDWLKRSMGSILLFAILALCAIFGFVLLIYVVRKFVR